MAFAPSGEMVTGKGVTDAKRSFFSYDRQDGAPGGDEDPAGQQEQGSFAVSNRADRSEQGDIQDSPRQDAGVPEPSHPVDAVWQHRVLAAADGETLQPGIRS